MNDVVMLLGPLRRYSNTWPIVMEKIATILMLPLINQVRHLISNKFYEFRNVLLCIVSKPKEVLT